MIQRKPLKPYITVEQVMAFDPEKPETATESREVNAILEAMHTLHTRRGCDIARYLGVNTVTVSSILRVTVGLTVGELSKIIARRTYEKLKAENPKITDKEIGEVLGYTHRASMWWLKHSEANNRRRNKKRADFKARRKAEREKAWNKGL